MIALVPVTVAVAQAVLRYDGIDGIDTALGVLSRVADWPHDDTGHVLRALAEHPGDTGPGTFLVVLERSGQADTVIGECGWFGPPSQGRSNEPDGQVEIGYGLAPSARGAGHGRAAVALLIDWVRAQGATSARAEVLPGNEPSLRLLTGLGFTRDAARAGHEVLVRDLEWARGGERHLAGRNRVG